MAQQGDSPRHFNRRIASGKIIVSECRYCFHTIAAKNDQHLKMAEQAHCCPERVEAEQRSKSR